MTPEQYQEASELMQRLGEMDAGEREAFLETLAPTLDAAVLQEVRDLVRFLPLQQTQLESSRRLLSTLQLPQHPRFVLGKYLGGGAFGDVYEATDQERQMPIAIKILKQIDADRLRRFRHEFRTLIGVSHRNLVKLYQLFFEGRWFFTMELVRGDDFLRYARPDGRPLEIGRLSDVLLQLAEGIEALHERKLLHRDIKPGNVLVTRDGRVVLLDFGLVKELVDQATQQTIAGTPDYMAPEQFGGSPITEAADWYAFGVILYQALSGQAPFRGTLPEIAALKAQGRAELPAECRDGVPGALVDLCHGLLEREPAKRPGAEEIFRVLRSLAGDRGAPQGEKKKGPANYIVGREGQLGQMGAALQKARDGRMVVATLRGQSGMGKTTLAQTFCRQMREAAPGTVILSGACYENELVPFKALDGLMEGLNSCLRALPAAVCEALLPYDFRCLTKLFPALAFQLPAPSSLREADILESQEVRKRAFTALLDLLQRLAERHPVVVFLDDLQWGDLDSAGFFRHLFRAANPPRLLFLAAYRAEDEGNAFLKVYREDLLSAGPDVLREEIDVGELSEEETLQMARHLGTFAGSAERQFQRLLEDCGGCPLLVEQFARHEGPESSLRDLLEKRVEGFGAEAKQLFELIAVAGQPIPEALLQSCIAGGQEETHGRLLLMLEDRLIRIQESAGQRMVDIYHARIRETVMKAMDPAQKRMLHLRLAECGASLSDCDPAFLSLHFLLAGEREQFTAYTVVAAERAFAALAFSRAAELYRSLIDHGNPGSGGVYGWRARLAQSLVNADRVVVTCPEKPSRDKYEFSLLHPSHS